MTLEYKSAEPLRDEVVSGVILARSIIAALPSIVGRAGVWRADVLALMVLLKQRQALMMKNICRDLGCSIAVAWAIVERCEGMGLVERRKDLPKSREISSRLRGHGDGKDARATVIVLTPKGKQLVRNSRGAKRALRRSEKP